MTVDARRANKRAQIVDFFTVNLGRRFDTQYVHQRFGPAFRSRKSEINKDASCPIVILNRTTTHRGRQQSVYWAEGRPEFMREGQPGRQQPSRGAEAFYPETAGVVA